MTEIRSAVEDEDDAVVRRRGGRLVRMAGWLVVVAVLSVGVTMAFDTSPFTTFCAVLLGVVILRSGWFFLQSFATPPPAPPEPGQMRKVKLTYRCSICGAEVRMTAAPSEEPEPPWHCLEDMDLVAPID